MNPSKKRGDIEQASGNGQNTLLSQSASIVEERARDGFNRLSAGAERGLQFDGGVLHAVLDRFVTASGYKLQLDGDALSEFVRKGGLQKAAAKTSLAGIVVDAMVGKADLGHLGNALSDIAKPRSVQICATHR